MISEQIGCGLFDDPGYVGPGEAAPEGGQGREGVDDVAPRA
jgi:hypothetical protein